MDHEKVLELQLLQCGMHGTRYAGSVAVLALETVTSAVDHCQQVQLSASVGGPEIGRVDLKMPDNLLNGESLPGGPQLRMAEQASPVADAQQSVQQSTVLNEHLGRFDLPFLDVLVPGLHDADHVGPAEDVEVPAGCHIRESQRRRQLRGVPDLAVHVGQHRPKPLELGWGRLDTEAPQIPLEKGVDEVVPPGGAVLVRRGQIRQRKPAPLPQRRQVLGADFLQMEPGHVDELDPPGEGLGTMPNDVGRGAAEDQESGGQGLSIRKHAQERKQIGYSLDLIDHDQSFQRSQGQRRILESPDIRRVLQIEVLRLSSSGESSGQGGLAALPRSEQGGYAATPQGRIDLLVEFRSFEPHV